MRQECLILAAVCAFEVSKNNGIPPHFKRNTKITEVLPPRPTRDTAYDEPCPNELEQARPLLETPGFEEIGKL